MGIEIQGDQELKLRMVYVPPNDWNPSFSLDTLSSEKWQDLLNLLREGSIDTVEMSFFKTPLTDREREFVDQIFRFNKIKSLSIIHGACSIGVQTKNLKADLPLPESFQLFLNVLAMAKDSLTDLRLYSQNLNQCSPHTFALLSRGFSQLEMLQSLTLSYCYIGRIKDESRYSNFLSLLMALKTSSHVTSLNLSDNRLTELSERSFEALWSAISQLPLTDLNVSNNELFLKKFLRINFMGIIAKNQRLSSLDISGNYLHLLLYDKTYYSHYKTKQRKKLLRRLKSDMFMFSPGIMIITSDTARLRELCNSPDIAIRHPFSNSFNLAGTPVIGSFGDRFYFYDLDYVHSQQWQLTLEQKSDTTEKSEKSKKQQYKENSAAYHRSITIAIFLFCLTQSRPYDGDGKLSLKMKEDFYPYFKWLHHLEELESLVNAPSTFCSDSSGVNKEKQTAVQALSADVVIRLLSFLGTEQQTNITRIAFGKLNNQTLWSNNKPLLTLPSSSLTDPVPALSNTDPHL